MIEFRLLAAFAAVTMTLSTAASAASFTAGTDATGTSVFQEPPAVASAPGVAVAGAAAASGTGVGGQGAYGTGRFGMSATGPGGALEGVAGLPLPAPGQSGPRQP